MEHTTLSRGRTDTSAESGVPGLAAAAPELTDALLARMDVPGPRYTSYPTADRFVEAFTAGHCAQALAQRGDLGGVGGAGAPMSIYVHVPFCESVCYYCACNKIVTRDHSRVAAYLKALEHELDLVCQALGEAPQVSQLHFGGGTPTYLDDDELRHVVGMIASRVRLLPQGEHSIEIDPRTVTRDRLALLKDLGFNRVSFGVQDFDPAVQQAVHRVQPHAQVEALMRDARELGFESINVDLIYGLPRQTPESFERTVRQVALLRPDRIAMYGYAHLPTRFKPQRRIVNAELPSGADRVGMLAQALAGFVSHGYQYIGMDHFALPEDALAQAKRQGRLHRNFQGYSTQPDCDLIGLGVSAISRVGATYSQNAKTLDEYYDLLKGDALPVVRGLALTRDDLVRRAVIMSIMCHGRLSYESVALAHLIDVRQYFAPELESLQDLARDGLVTLHEDGLEVTPLGWYFVRSVAMVFDRHLRADRSRERFSKVI
ncbi:oxygen-independent coproporphyrinogen III oxidase [uncultured Sphaerotilus sp.]|uniref:oxygen-independent coproporphyrinogen III oxidase n=1 Tax=uncultured Sphaerotilus sp. TaxID=474984 RepID=UPI0030CA4398